MPKIRDDEVYPNSPLTEVVCEARFPGEMEVECNRHLFWNRVRDRYSVIGVPGAQAGQAPALQHYRFQDMERGRIVSVAINSLAMSDTRYAGHDSFIMEFSRLATIFGDCYRGIDRVKRLGWRYINIIPFTRGKNGLVPISDFLKINVKLGTDVMGGAKGLDLTVDSATKGGTIQVHIATVKSVVDDSKEALLVDIDYGRESDLIRFSNINKHVTDARRQGRQFFEELITDRYRQYLRGRTL